jgi:hypothetical protein
VVVVVKKGSGVLLSGLLASGLLQIIYRRCLHNVDSILNPSLNRLIGLYFEFPLLWHYLVVVVVVKRGDGLRRTRKIMVELAIMVEPPGTP